MSHNFQITNADTDSISFCKKDHSPFSKEEIDNLVKEINDISPEFMEWENDGYYKSFLVVKAKNYVMVDTQGKMTIKGSALKATSKEPALKEFNKKTIDHLLEGRVDLVLEDYNGYVKEAFNVKDISRWCSRQTVTEKVLDPKRTNEQKKLDCIAGSEYKIGDKFYSYYDMEGKMILKEHWKDDHDSIVFLEKLYANITTFSTVLDITLFPKYTLKKNKAILEALLK